MADEPKKYIRTYEGDVEMLQKGGTPDLKPLVPKPPAPAEPAAKAPPVPLGPPPNLPGADTPFPLPNIPKPTTPPRPVPAPPPPPPTPPPPKPEPITLPPIQTYAGDFAQRMKETKASTATVLAAEQDAGAAGAPPAVKPRSTSELIAIIAGVVLLLLGGSGVYIAYTRYVASNAPITPPSEDLSPIFVNEREQVPETPTELRLAIEQSLAHPLTSNSVRLLHTTFSTTTGNSIFAILAPSAPNVLLRNINALGSMAGVVNVDGTQTPFFILSVASYSDTFAGMLSWEPKMPDDLAPLFPPYPSPITVAPAVSSTTPLIATTTLMSTSTPQAVASVGGSLSAILFHDEIINGHDARVYRDVGGRTVLLYGYSNQRTLLIARSEAAFIEIMTRLLTSRTQ